LAGLPRELSAYLCRQYGAKEGQIVACGKEEWFSPVASGSAAPKQMVVCPCSMGTVSAIANGTGQPAGAGGGRGDQGAGPADSGAPGEPFSAIHLENMLKLARLGVTIMPAAPGFYHEPKSIEDLVDLSPASSTTWVEHELTSRWGYANH
jgi:4-hydroxy-3-polyprenylbenzoate decarboxylase